MSIWNKFKRTVENKFPNFEGALEKGVSIDQITSFESNYKLSLPKDFKEMYQASNGQNNKVNAYFFGMEVLSLEGIISAIDLQLSVMDDLAEEWDMCSSNPVDHIKLGYVNPGWVPIFHGGSGNYLGVDLDPGPTGTIGQIINFGRDDEDKFVLADSLESFLTQCIDKIESGEHINYNEEYKMYFYTDHYFVDALIQECLRKNA